jgi:hypothetical protein
MPGLAASSLGDCPSSAFSVLAPTEVPALMSCRNNSTVIKLRGHFSTQSKVASANWKVRSNYKVLRSRHSTRFER